MKSLFQVALSFVIAFVLAAAAHGDGFTSTGGLTEARYNHTATLLPNGKVLVAGGESWFIDSGENIEDTFSAGAELYDPATGIWTPTGSLADARAGHTATLLPNGKVLVAGGFITAGGYLVPISTAELYNPTNGTWTTTGSPAHGGKPAILLPNGKVLAVGYSTAELYDPATGTWSSTGSPAHGGDTATLLPNGNVLVAGGGTNTAELYNPTNGTWTATGNLVNPRTAFTATLLPNGKVLVAGGEFFPNGGPILILTNAEVYNPSNGTWSATGSLANPRYGHTATLLPNGKVLVSGGNGTGITSSAELYDPATGTWSATGDLANPRYSHTATPLANGNVLIAGGVGLFGFILTSAELYVPAPSFLNPILNPTKLADGSFRFGLSNLSGPSCRILASPNATAPLNTWSNLGPATETPPGSGQFQFTDHQATNYPRRFYRVTSP